MKKFLLYLSANERQLWAKEGQGWAPFPGKPDGHVWVVADFAEESIAEIKTPRLVGKDRSAFLNRQLTTRFPETRYRGFLTPPQGDDLLGYLIPTKQLLIGIDAAPRLDAELDAEPLSYAGVWPISMLMAAVGKRRGLPPDLFLVFPGEDVLRIVFLKNRSPVLTRLTLTPNQAKAQVDEIIRTQRYLENNQIVPREGQQYALLLFGDPASWEQPAAAAGISLVRDPGWKSAPHTDWRFPLFDLAVQSPPGQVAPLERRTSFLADRVGKAALMAAVILLLTAGIRSGGNLLSIVRDMNEQNHVTSSLQQVSARIAEIDERIRQTNVSPDTVRRAVALDAEEIESVPSMELHWRKIAGILSSDPSLRLKELRWSILDKGATPCGATVEANPGSETGDKRQIELVFDLIMPDSYGPRDRALSIRRISTQMAEIDGLTLWQDALKNITGGSLRGGPQQGASEKLSWCVSLPGTPPPPVPTEAKT
jgi:hypothetical protein